MEIIFFNSDDYMGQIADVSTTKVAGDPIDTFLDSSVIRQNPFCIDYSTQGDALNDFREIFSRANGQSVELKNIMRDVYKRHFMNLNIIMAENNIGIGNIVKKELNSYILYNENNSSNTYCAGCTYPSKITMLKKSLVDNLINNSGLENQTINDIIFKNKEEYLDIEKICTQAYVNVILNNKDRKNNGVFNSIGKDDSIIAECILYSSIKEIPVSIVSADKDFEMIAVEIEKMKNEFDINFNVSFYYMMCTNDGMDISYKKTIIK